MHISFPVYCTLWVLTWANLPDSTAIEPRVCGTKPPSKELLAVHQEFLCTHRQLKARDQPNVTVQAQIVIDTYIHFVTTKDQAPFYSANFLSYAYDNQVCLSLSITLILSIFLYSANRALKFVSCQSSTKPTALRKFPSTYWPLPTALTIPGLLIPTLRQWNQLCAEVAILR